MAIYFILLILIFFGCFLFKGKKNKKFLIYTFFLFSLISCLRSYTVGADTSQYYNFFNNIPIDNFNYLSYRYEIFFSYFVYFIKIIFGNAQFLLIITSIFINFSVFRFIYKNSDNFWLSVLVYLFLNFFFKYMNIMRQAISISIILLFFDSLKEKKILKFLVGVFLASLFHQSALLSILLILPFYLKINKRNIFISFVIFILCFIFGNSFFTFLTKFSVRLSGYLTGEYSVSNYFGSLIIFFLNLYLYVIGLYILRKEYFFKDRNNEYHSLIGIICLAVLFSALVTKVNIFNRFTHYFDVFLIIWIPNIYEKITKSKNNFLFIICVLFVLFLYWLIIMVYRPEWYGTVPYKFFWQ